MSAICLKPGSTYAVSSDRKVVCSKVTPKDVLKIIVEPFCDSCAPCAHATQVTLKDGRVGMLSDAYPIRSVISEVASEKINPNGKIYFQEKYKRKQAKYDAKDPAERDKWGQAELLEHFKDYNTPRPKWGWEVKTAEEVLSKMSWESPGA